MALLELEKLTSTELDALPRDRTVFFFPVGSLEDRGPHLALGLDPSRAEALCRLAADRIERELPGWVGVLGPRAPLGVQTVTTAFALPVRAHVLRDWLVDACRGLERAGFLHFVCFSGNLAPRQLAAIEDAGKIISTRTPWKRLRRALSDRRGQPFPSLVCASAPLVPPGAPRRAPFWPEPAEHGGNIDSSVALAVGSATLVRPEYASIPPAPAPESGVKRLWLRLNRRLRGYWGDPSRASVEAGTKTLTEEVDLVFPKLRAVWDGSLPNYLFRSYYSVLPPNKSFAQAWALGLSLAGVVWIWVLLMSGG